MPISELKYYHPHLGLHVREIPASVILIFGPKLSFSFWAGALILSVDLGDFLRTVEGDARLLGFLANPEFDAPDNLVDIPI